MLYTPPKNTPQKMKGKELSTHIQTLLAQMEDADKEEFFDDTAKSGFQLGELNRRQFLLPSIFTL